MGFTELGAIPAMLDELIGATAPPPPPLVVPTGYAGLDALLGGGLHAGHLAMVGGVPGVGASTFALGLARKAAVSQRLRTMLVDPDSTERDTVARILAAEAKVAIGHIRTGQLDESDRLRLAARRQVLTDAPLMIDAGWDSGAGDDGLVWTVSVAAEIGARVVVVDGTGQAEPMTRSLLLSLRVLAQAHQLVVVVVTHAVKPPGQHAEPPGLHDLWVDASVLDLLDLVLLLHREDLHHLVSDRPGEADLFVALNRHGPTSGPSAIAFQGHYARFADMVSAPPSRT